MNEYTVSLLQLFGERYIFCDDEQAIIDATHNREQIVDTFCAILDYARKTKETKELPLKMA